jgi:hypothetical protein
MKISTTLKKAVFPYWTSVKSQRKSYITADGQSASLSWYQATIWDPRPIFFHFFVNYI